MKHQTPEPAAVCLKCIQSLCWCVVFLAVCN